MSWLPSPPALLQHPSEGQGRGQVVAAALWSWRRGDAQEFGGEWASFCKHSLL